MGQIRKSDIIIALFVLPLFLFLSTLFCRSEKYCSSAFLLAFTASSNFPNVPRLICFLSTVIYALYLSLHFDTPVIPVLEFYFPPAKPGIRYTTTLVPALLRDILLSQLAPFFLFFYLMFAATAAAG
ncbi:MAG: hypothetical protein ACLU45_01650 [Dialister invisus]|uniref:hypothetical protein n=1 Tax=Dialister invisus TaxID=218538 RepID=UPI003999E5E5